MKNNLMNILCSALPACFIGCADIDTKGPFEVIERPNIEGAEVKFLEVEMSKSGDVILKNKDGQQINHPKIKEIATSNRYISSKIKSARNKIMSSLGIFELLESFLEKYCHSNESREAMRSIIERIKQEL